MEKPNLSPETHSEFTIKIFSSSTEDVFVPDQGKVEAKVEVKFVDALNRARASISKFKSMSEYDHCIIVAGNMRSNGIASSVAYAILAEEPNLVFDPVLYEDKWENILFGMEVKKLEVK